MKKIEVLHREMVGKLAGCDDPLSERARELRVMVMRLEGVKPELERKRVAVLIGNGSPMDALEDEGLE